MWSTLQPSTHSGLHVAVGLAEVELAVDSNRCVEILREAGFLRSGPFLSVIRLLDVPWGLDAGALEVYLRDHGAEICRAGA
jgi:hypothetical protein